MKKFDATRIGRRLLLLLFPPKCVGCGELMPIREGMTQVFCPFCRTKWEASRISDEERIITWDAPVCGLVSVVGYATGETDGVPERLIYHLKHKDERRVFDYAADELARPLRALLSRLSVEKKTVWVTYPPRRPKAITQDGFDQAKRLAQALSRREGFTFSSLLARKKKGREQKRLGAVERRENAKLAYGLKDDCPNLTGKTVLLVDDLYTTGATLRACAALLVSAGAERVILATVGRTSRSRR